MIRFFETAKKGILLAGIFFCGVFFVYPADDTLLLTPDKAAEMAVNNNLSLEMARIGTDIKERKKNYSWNNFLPSLTATGTMSHDNWATVTQGIDFTTMRPYSMQLPQWHLNGAFSATLDFSAALIEGLRSSRLDYEAGLITFEKARLQIEQAVRKMYNNILLLEANKELMNDSYANAMRQVSMADANYRAGLAPRLTLIQAQVAAENMKPAINDLDNTLKSLKGNFALILGLPYDAPFKLESISFRAADISMGVKEMISLAAAEKPDIQELRANILTLQSQKKALSISNFTPFLRLGWTVTSLYNPMLDPFKDDLFKADNWNKGGNFSLTLGMSLNGLLPFTKEGQQRKDMEASIQIQNIRLAQMVQETELELITKLNSLEKTLATAEAQQAAIQLAELSYRLTSEAYRAGLQDFQSVQGASLALEQARLQLLRENFNYLNDLIDLEYLIGVPFGTLSSSGTLNNRGSGR